MGNYRWILWGAVILTTTACAFVAFQPTAGPTSAPAVLNLTPTPTAAAVTVTPSPSPTQVTRSPSATQPSTSPAPTQTPLLPTPTIGIITSETSSQLVELARLGKGKINNFVWSPDSATLAVSTSLGIYLYAAGTLTETGFISGTGEVAKMVFSPDGEFLAVTAANLPAIRIWRQSEATLFNTIEIPNAWNSSLAFSPDGSLLAVGKPEGVEFWRVSDGVRLQTFGVPIPYIEGQFHNVTALAFSPDGALIATADINPYKTNRQVNVWRMKDGKLLRRINGYQAGIDSLAFGPDNQLLAVASGAHIDLYRATTGTKLRTYAARRAGLPKTIDLSFNADGSTLSFVLSDGYVQTNKVSTGKLLAAWDIRPDEDGESFPALAQASISPDGSRLAALETNKTLRLWRVDGTLLATLEGHYDDYHQLILSPDGSLLGAALGDDGDIQVWRLSDLNLRFIVRQSGFVFPLQLTSLAFSPNGKTVAASGPGAKFWQTSDGTLERTIESSELRKMGIRDILAFSPDLEQNVVSAIAGDKEQTWLARTADLTKLYKLVEAPRKDVSTWTDLVFAGDRGVAAGSRKGTVSVWRTRDGKLITSFDEQARRLVFAPGGEILATCRGDRIRLWQVDDGALLETIKVPPDIENDGFTSLAFSPDGKLIATGTAGGKIWIWEAASGALLGTLNGHRGPVTGIVFTLDGEKLISAAEDGTLRVWGVHFSTPR